VFDRSCPFFSSVQNGRDYLPVSRQMVIDRYLGARVRADLARKMVVLTGPRQAGKTTLARAIMEAHPAAQ
jgi:type II secretory pathway predicted ATPase ExeA